MFIIILTIIFTVFESIISVGYVLKRKYSFLAENIAIYIVYLVYLYIEHRLPLNTRWYLILLVVLTILGHVFAGEFLDMYNKSKLYDRLLHAFGSFSFALFTYSAIYKTIKPVSDPKLYTVIFIVNLGITLGVLFELLEFMVDIFFKTRSQSGLKDTNVDLIADIIGSIIAGCTYALFNVI